MAKKRKLKTPDWIVEGYDSEAEYNKVKGIKKEVHRFPRDDPKRASVSPKAYPRRAQEPLTRLNCGGKTFRIRRCFKCNSDDIGVVLGEIGIWKCKKCGYKGRDIKEEELSESEFMKYLDEKGEEVA